MILTKAGFDCSYSAAMKEISCTAQDSMLIIKWLYTGKDKSKLAWLFMYALDSYNYGAVDNYITEEQVSAMFAKVNLL